MLNNTKRELQNYEKRKNTTKGNEAMKNENRKANKTKLIARVMLVVILVASTVTLSGCGQFEYEWEVNSHKEFVEKIEQYNSIHNIYVDTFISFDLDDNEQVSKRLYSQHAMISPRTNSFEKDNGYICDIHNELYGIRFLYYLRSNNENINEYSYKVKCYCLRTDFNFTENDKIEILSSEYEKGSNLEYDLSYEETLEIYGSDEGRYPLYNYVYHYSVYVEGVEVCCIHISSIDEATDEKLDEIIQMLSNSLVVLNTEKFFIWRNRK